MSLSITGDIVGISCLCLCHKPMGTVGDIGCYCSCNTKPPMPNIPLHIPVSTETEIVKILKIPHKCPVCDGDGKVTKYEDAVLAVLQWEEKCHPCKGEGIVWG